MKKNIFFVIACLLLASCTKEEITELNVPQQEVNARASNDVFKAVKIDAFLEGEHSASPKTVDNEGNLYWATTDGSIYKYDHLRNEAMLFSTLGSGSMVSFCFDNNNNLCYIDSDHRQGDKYIYRLRRITQDGSYYDQEIIFPNPYEWIYVTGMFANPNNGNITVMTDIGPFKISARGVVTEAIANWTPITGIELYKASGNLGYYVGYDNFCYRINFGTGVVDEIEFKMEISPYGGPWSFAACTGKANLYGLDGRYIVQIRPNAATDLDIGVIPNSYLDTQGNRIEIIEPSHLYMNSDATIFYIYCSDNVFHKLTL